MPLFTIRKPRPPRPSRVVTNDFADAAETMGIPPEEILTVTQTATGPVVETTDGQRYILLPEGEKDAIGQEGVLILPDASRPKVRYGRYYVDPAELDRDMAGAAWTVDDLEYAVRTTRMPANQGDRLAWAGNDPIRAYCVLKSVAREHHLTVQVACTRLPEAMKARDVIIASGWLSEVEAEKL